MPTTSWSTFVDSAYQKTAGKDSQDIFSERDGVSFAGTHLLVDCWGASRLSEIQYIEDTLRQAVKVTGATLLHIHLHHFTPNGGVSGVAVLAESHISIHTWPERGYAALDIFMCGDTHPEKAVPLFKKAFNASSVEVTELLRGVVPDHAESKAGQL